MLFQRMAIRTAALVLFASCLTARADVPVFFYGTYGVLNKEGKTSKDKYKDMEPVTSTINKLINSNKGKSDYKSMNDIFQKDPIPGKVKTLHLAVGDMADLGSIRENDIGEYDMDGFWRFIASERSKKGK